MLYDKRTVNVQIRKLIGDPVFTSIEAFGCDNYDDDVIASYADHFGFERREVKAFTAEYLGWFEVLVLRSQETEKDIGAAFILERGEWTADTLEAIEADIVLALIDYTTVTFEM